MFLSYYFFFVKNVLRRELVKIISGNKDNYVNKLK